LIRNNDSKTKYQGKKRSLNIKKASKSIIGFESQFKGRKRHFFSFESLSSMLLIEQILSQLNIDYSSNAISWQESQHSQSH
jgi:hypothetical protein